MVGSMRLADGGWPGAGACRFSLGGIGYPAGSTIPGQGRSGYRPPWVTPSVATEIVAAREDDLEGCPEANPSLAVVFIVPFCGGSFLRPCRAAES